MNSPKTSKGKRIDVLNPAPQASDFNIYHRDENGRPDMEYYPDHPIATCVVRAINICRKMLGTAKVQLAFTKLAEEYVKARPNAWFLSGPERNDTMADQANKFCKMVLDRFPTIFVDDTIRNPNIPAAHGRLSWHEQFKTSDHYILVNGPLAQHMLAAAIIANSSEKENLETKDYRAFLFQLANAIFHEVGHVFFTYLTKGIEHTPNTLRPTTSEFTNMTEGEAGRCLEQLVFGGCIGTLRDPITGSPDGSCGIPYLNTQSGWFRITQETIDRTFNSDFRFPYDHVVHKDNIKELQTMGWDETGKYITNPQGHEDWPKLRDAPRPTGP